MEAKKRGKATISNSSLGVYVYGHRFQQTGHQPGLDSSPAYCGELWPENSIPLELDLIFVYIIQYKT